MIVPNIPQDIL